MYYKNYILSQEEVRLRKLWLALTMGLYLFAPAFLALASIYLSFPLAALLPAKDLLLSLLPLIAHYFFVFKPYRTGFLTFSLAVSIVGLIQVFKLVLAANNHWLMLLFGLYLVIYSAWFYQSLHLRRLHKRIRKKA